MTDASFNRKITAVEDELGLLGSGLWWRIMEIVGAQFDEKRQTFAEHSAKTWGNFCKISPKLFRKYSEILGKNNLIFIKISENSIRIDIPNMLEFIDEHTRRRIKDSGVTPERLRSNSYPDTDTDTDTEEEEKREEDIYIPNSRALETNGSEKPKTGAAEKNPLFDEIIGEYHRLLPELPRYGIWSSKDYRNVKLSIEAFPERAAIAFWSNLFGVAARCPYLLGKNGRSRGQPWKASLTWLIEFDNIANILNEKYLPGENKSAGQKTYEALKDEVWE